MDFASTTEQAKERRVVIFRFIFFNETIPANTYKKVILKLMYETYELSK